MRIKHSLPKMIICAAALAAFNLFAADLERGFYNPPHAAKPHTWYHIMNGNATKAGMTKDFEALAKSESAGSRCSMPGVIYRQAI